ncbi:uncharacterized protein STEHIDRAFT_116303 [Stereum hirsutum FP-91666 SS1]|uniref:DNA topoisomerase (ATP-hydrolyzing) n=1 Tax=Stereum hirsutum (strain FP-91666) TaxID=721885 RepID=R7RWS6_STEHR|nr:uncharacterized protein STEHIDRAFT_116303 [Stereum hirsutum FP-91666 SS1]EIM79831.1 hypothetical protein STEHIDRAFT_116303 [Stereum hirsutum FP-91666 SS1]
MTPQAPAPCLPSPEAEPSTARTLVVQDDVLYIRGEFNMVDSSSSTVADLVASGFGRWSTSIDDTVVISPGHSSLAAKTLSTSTMSVSQGKNAINQHIALSIAPRTHQRSHTHHHPRHPKPLRPVQPREGGASAANHRVNTREQELDDQDRGSYSATNAPPCGKSGTSATYRERIRVYGIFFGRLCAREEEASKPGAKPKAVKPVFTKRVTPKKKAPLFHKATRAAPAAIDGKKKNTTGLYQKYELPLLSSLLPTHPVCHSYPGPKRILKHLDLDIGSAETTTQNIWTHDWATKCMVVRDVKYVPGFIKIVDEILFNAANNKINDPNGNVIKIEFDVPNSSISLYNNGRGIPIENHPKGKIYIPGMICRHPLPSSNYHHDGEKKRTKRLRTRDLEEAPNLFDYDIDEISISDIVMNELILFLYVDNVRFIPRVANVMSLARGRSSKVASGVRGEPKSRQYSFISFPVHQLAQLGYIFEHATCYHGEQSLTRTIVNLTQDYVGVTNLNLFMPSAEVIFEQEIGVVSKGDVGEWDVGMGLQAACAWDDQQELPAKCTLHFLEITVRLRSFAPLIPPPTANDFVDHLGRAAPQTEGWRPSWIPTPKFPPTYLIGPNCNTSTRATTPMLTPAAISDRLSEECSEIELSTLESKQRLLADAHYLNFEILGPRECNSVPRTECQAIQERRSLLTCVP